MLSAAPIPTTNPPQIWLSKSVSVADYRKLEAARDQKALSQFVRDRFTERYLAPLDVEPDKKSGFTMMAIACLMIEALESFSRGWSDTTRRSEHAFCSFFARWDHFAEFRPYSAKFYKHIRCALLHQAETTGRWRILRRGLLLDPHTKTLNATSFVKRLERVLKEYSNQLRDEAWDSETWKCFRKKMASVCKNAEGA